MKKSSLYNKLIVLIILFTTHSAFSQEEKQNILSERISNYEISVTLDTKMKMLLGKEILTWKNTSLEPVQELQFHLYMNAFKNTSSTFMYELENSFQSNFFDSKDVKLWGWIDIEKMTLVTGEDLKNNIKFIQPDDGNPLDQTVISVKLPKPIPSGESIEINFTFKTKLPKIIARTGYVDDYYFVGQWFPKIGVLEKPGVRYSTKIEWNCHQFHANSEFYSDFGNYNVSISIPDNFEIATNGVLQGVKQNLDGTKTMNYQALDIIDFVWSTSPKFLLKTRKWNNTDISLYIQESHKSLENRYIESAIKALDYLDKHIGSYPYPNLTIVDPPFNGIKSGGMEYPGLITGFAFLKLPKNIRSLEAVVIHETIHQYFMGLIASNEFEEAWLDEGFTAYLETRIMDEIYGENKSIINFMGVQIGDLTIQRDAYLHGPNAKAAETFRFSWDFPNNSYAELCYSKPAIFLTTLERILGRKLMDKILQEYFNKFKFKHPCSQDFIKIAKETSQKEGFNNSDFFDSFFNQFLYESTTCDYELCKITNKEIIGKVGAFDKQTTKVIKLNSDNGKEIYRSSVVLKRNGELTIPTEVLITFDSGEKMIKLWDGKARYKEFTFEGNSQIISAQIDPSNKIMIDSDLNNNSKTTDPKNFGIWKYVAKFLFWLQNIMQSVAFFA